ncbi:MAG: hypothetical protein EXS38_02585 [Opitutus sp.]|nr:hypothetical protein [Opitutus sp.]
MKSNARFFAAILAACFICAAAFAADASPSGTWKFTQPGRGGNPGAERTLKLDLKDGKLTGTLMGTQGGQFQIPDTAIGNASYQDGAIAFTVEVEFNGNRFVSKYAGKLEGDSIKGSIERPGRDGNIQKSDWNAARAK